MTAVVHVFEEDAVVVDHDVDKHLSVLPTVNFSVKIVIIIAITIVVTATDAAPNTQTAISSPCSVCDNKVAVRFAAGGMGGGLAQDHGCIRCGSTHLRHCTTHASEVPSHVPFLRAADALQVVPHESRRATPRQRG